jgi:hypothetical protein
MGYVIEHRWGNYTAWLKNGTQAGRRPALGKQVAGAGRLPSLMDWESARAVEEGQSS